MSIECSYCERDLRSGHSDGCGRPKSKRSSVRQSDAIKLAAEAHSNLNTWGAVRAILEGGLLYGSTSQHKAANRVITIAKTEQQKFLGKYDSAIKAAAKEKTP